ncbi:MAG: glycerol-3-phosphate 1-O-acyltransferase PlsY [Holosporales bacterium]|jgi:glycerol-3-phosphate acyltransferase PlsY|nr:glycerol-3-phosphate 1-O-acyltransferase PlsY [Holosporales bacterium]
MNLLTLCVIGYIVGSIPTGFLLAKFGSGIDLRNFGSHSVGATNVLRTGNKKQAALTLLIDATKGILFSLFVKLFVCNPYALVAVFFCIIGHVYPIWLSFKGGKGVATSAGIFLTLSPGFALVSIIIWALTAKITRVSSLASILLSVSFTVLTLYGYIVGDAKLDVLLFAIGTLFFLLYTHLDNIKRLINKEEEAVAIK